VVERPINDFFAHGSVLLKVIERPTYNPEIDIGILVDAQGKRTQITEENYNACYKCFYFRKSYCKTLPIRGECSDRNREDEKKVIFIQIANEPL
jgi:hypothetical protein